MEAEFFTAVKHSFRSVIGEKAVVFSQYGTSEELNEQGKGYPVLRLNEFDSAFIGRPAKYCELSSAEFAELQLRDGDVLICRTNGNPKLVGKSALVPKDYQYAFASYLFRVRPDIAIINSETLVAYLNSRFGRHEIEQFAMRGNQANFSPAKFRQIQVPVLGSRVNNAIKELTRRAFSNNEKSKAIYCEAEQMLLTELGFAGWSPTDAAVSVKSYSDFVSAGRLDAEYFQPKYDELFTLLDKGKTRPLGGKDGLVDIQRSIEPGSDTYSDKGIPFVRIADFTEMGIMSPEIRISPEICADSPRPKKDTILLSKDGSVGIAYKVEEDLDIVTSSGILHLLVKDVTVLPDYLTLVLNSKIVRLQAERDAGGSIIQHWKRSEIERVRIPLLPLPRQRAIATKVQSSFALRAESKRLLGIAKRMVEMAVEQGETVALEWLGQMKV